jgi:hypothetical protein
VVKARRKEAAAELLPAGLTLEILDQLVAGVQTSADFQLVWWRLQKAMAERVLKAELTHHLGYPEGGERGPDGNARNGSSPKRLLTESGPVDLEVPRDRAGSFTPQFVPTGARRLPGFDETVLMLYARGLSTRELQAFLEEWYQIPVSPDLISTVTNEVLAEADTWQQRPLEHVYVAVAFDALCVKIRDEGIVQNKAVYLALGVHPDSTKEVLGFWIAQTEGAAFLASRLQRAAGPRRDRHLGRPDRRADGAAGRAARRVSAHRDPSVRRASRAPEPAVRDVEGSEGGRGRAPGDPSSARRGGSPYGPDVLQ